MFRIQIWVFQLFQKVIVLPWLHVKMWLFIETIVLPCLIIKHAIVGNNKSKFVWTSVPNSLSFTINNNSYDYFIHSQRKCFTNYHDWSLLIFKPGISRYFRIIKNCLYRLKITKSFIPKKTKPQFFVKYGWAMA